MHTLNMQVSANAYELNQVKLVEWDKNSEELKTLDIEVGDNIQWKLKEGGSSKV
jgi:hypothetical protein